MDITSLFFLLFVVIIVVSTVVGIVAIALSPAQQPSTQLSLAAIVARNNQLIASTHYCHECHVRHGEVCPNA